ncbi:hypothetical protein [Pseudomonas sp. IT-P4]|uniref:hypothetical protein n=1 Tax=Pseudomonas sp. IT-P4 TaxID=3026446 RepID=UPI0039E01819
MAWIKLSSPTVRETPETYAPFAWPDGRFQAFPAIWDAPPAREDIDVLTVIERRRSRRSFVSLNHDQLGQLFWHCARTQGIATSDLGFDLEQRPTPSAGAIHPIHILVKPAQTHKWFRYDARRHGLLEVEGSESELKPLEECSKGVLPSEDATQLLLVAEPGKTSAKYECGESLIWRDAGALLAIMAVTAEALNLAFCPLGITGEPWASELAAPGILMGVGMALVGGNPDRPPERAPSKPNR